MFNFYGYSGEGGFSKDDREYESKKFKQGKFSLRFKDIKAFKVSNDMKQYRQESE